MAKFNLIEWLKKVFDFLKDTFEDLVMKVIKARETQAFMAAAGQIIKEEVLSAGEEMITGGEKQKLAFSNIEDRVKSAGISYTTWLINWGIEQAVAALKLNIEA